MILRSLALAAMSLTLAACNISGTTQKGPFKPGSPVSGSQLDGTAEPIASTTINTQVTNSQGSFIVDQIDWNGWTELVVSGQYFNEFSNADSTDSITLNAITYKNRRFDTANIHLFSHLAAARMRQRIADGQNNTSAWRDTQTEMSNVFGLSRISRSINRGVEQLSLIEGNGRYRRDNANLLLLTGSFLATNGDATSLQALTDDFADDAQFNGVGESAFNALAIAGNTNGLLETLSQNLSSNGASNPPNNGDMQDLPIWVNTNDVGEVDVTAPEITINGNDPAEVEVGTIYEDDGATATDLVEGDVFVDANENINSDVIGEYTVTYTATDNAGNTATEIRQVNVVDTTKPVIELLGENPQSFEAIDSGSDLPYQDPGSSVTDNYDTDLVASVDTSELDLTTPGEYTVTYTAIDSSDNEAEAVIRNVIVTPSIPDPYRIVFNIETPDSDQPFLAYRNINPLVLTQGIEFVVDIVDENGTVIGAEPEFDISTVDVATPGTYPLLLSITDDYERTVTRMLNVIVSNVAPVAQSQIVTFDEDTNNNDITLAGTDADQFDSLAFSINTQPTNGSLGGIAPNVTYTPVADFAGTDSFEFTVSDGLLSSTATVSITVNDIAEPNTAPVAANQSISIDEDSNNNAITLNATDAESDALTFTISSPPTSGSLGGIAPNVTYTPVADFAGTDSFEFTVSDGVLSSTATVSITVIDIAEPNTAPVAANQSISVDEDTSNNAITLEATDAESDALTFTISSPPTSGSLGGTAPNVTYTPEANFVGTDSFQFAVSDGVLSSTATVTIIINDVTAPIILLNGASSIEIEAGTTYEELGATASDNIDANLPVVIAGDVVDTTTPKIYIVTYNVLDSAGNPALQVTRQVTVVLPEPYRIVFNVEGIPFSNLDDISLKPSRFSNPETLAEIIREITSVITANDEIVEGEPTFDLSGVNFSVIGESIVDLSFIDDFNRVVTNEITINVSNTAPEAQGQEIDVNQDVSTNVITLVGTDVDPNDVLNIGLVSSPSNGVLSGEAPNVIYTPNAGFVGRDAFTFTVNDGLEASNATVVIQVLDTVRPILELIGEASIEVFSGSSYIESGATATDNNDSDLNIVIAGDTVDTNAEIGDEFIITYNVSDAAGNAALEVIRVVTITESPVVASNTCMATEFTELGEGVGQPVIGDFDGEFGVIILNPAFEDYFVINQSPDIPWPEDQSYTAVTVSEIEDIFNEARAYDYTSNGKALKMPSQTIWDSYTDAEKGLFLINSERCIRGIRPYEGVDTQKNIDPSKDYAERLAALNLAGELQGLSHDEDGSPKDRLERAGVYEQVSGDVSQADINADFFQFSENLAWNYVGSSDSNSTVYEPIAKAVYGWLYDDKEATQVQVIDQPVSYTYGHRKFVLATGLVENSGAENIEGVISFGTALSQSTSSGIGRDGLEFTQFGTEVYTVQNGFDPNGNYDMSNVQSVDLIQPDSCIIPSHYHPAIGVIDGEIIEGEFDCYPEPQ